MTAISRTLRDAVETVPTYLARQAIITAAERGAITRAARERLVRLLNEGASWVARREPKSSSCSCSRYAADIGQVPRRVMHLAIPSREHTFAQLTLQLWVANGYERMRTALGGEPFPRLGFEPMQTAPDGWVGIS